MIKKLASILGGLGVKDEDLKELEEMAETTEVTAEDACDEHVAKEDKRKLIDEIGGWWIGRKLQLSAMTTNLQVKFRKPVSSKADDTIELRCRLKEQKRAFVVMSVTLTQGGEVCTEAELTYYCFSREVSDTQFRFQPFLLEGETHE